MATAISERASTQAARPLNVLVPLIRKDFESAKEAEKQAGLPYYRAAGEKMLEAREGSFRDTTAASFWDWISRTFGISKQQATRYMDLADFAGSSRARATSTSNFNSLREAERAIYASRDHGTGKTNWHEPVKQILGRVDIDTLRESGLKRAEEREAERKLALQLIDIGYKTLATKLHPDKGGSRDAMARLNQVRDRLKAHA